MYGCDVAKGEEGKLFVDTLSKLTKADIAASDNLTGANNLGGDWRLEYTNGSIEANTLIAENYTLTLTNTAPTLDATKSPTMGNVTADAPAPTNGSTTGSVLVSSIINAAPLNNFSDVDASDMGIAITGVSASGTLYYSTDAGANWNAVGVVSASSARTLYADANTMLYFKPNTGYSGSLSNAITFKAWDQTGGYSNGASGVDVSDSIGATFAGVCDTSGEALNVAVSGNYAYVADRGSGFKIINISNLASPTLAGTYYVAGEARSVVVSGNYAYVGYDVPGLQIIDVSAPASPTLVGTYNTNTSGYARGVALSGNYAYVAAYDSGLQIINISNPALPTLVGTYNTPSYANGVAVSGNYAYVADFTSGLQIIDISSPASPTLVTTYDTSGSAFGVTISGNYAYVADGSSGLQIIDISAPTSPTLAGTYDTSGYAFGVTISGNYAYVADYGSGLQTIDISTPASPTLAGTYDTPGTAFGVTISGNYAYVGDMYSGLQIIQLTPLSTAFSSASDTVSTVIVANALPTLTTLSNITSATEDTEKQITFNDLTTAGDEADTDGTVEAFIVKAVTTGTLKIGTTSGAATAYAAGTNDTIDTTKSAFWTPASNANTTLNAFTVVAKDDTASESATPVQVKVETAAVNDAPTVATPLTNQTATTGIAFTHTFGAGTFADVDTGDTLTYTATLASGAALPSWLTFDPATRTFSGTPASADAGTINTRVAASDGTLSVNSDFAIAVSVPASVTGVTSSTANGSYKQGGVVSVQVNFTESVTITGTPQLTLETGTTDRVLDYAIGTGTSTLTFTYTVQAGDMSQDLDYVSTSALSLNSGTIVATTGGAATTLTMPTPGAANSLGANKAILIDTAIPTDISLSSSAISTSSANNAVVGALSSTDATTGDTFTYAIVAGVGDTDNASFTISGSNLQANTPSTLSAGAKSVRVKTTDAAGNTYEEAMSVTVSNNPTLTITSDKATVKSGETANLTLTFSAIPTGFTGSDITISGGSLSAITATADPKVFTTIFTPTTNTQSLSSTISVAANTFTDATPDNNIASNTLTITGDTLAPTITSISRQTPSTATTDADTLVYRVTFSEIANYIDATDFGVSGTTATITNVAAVVAGVFDVFDVTVSGGDLASLNGDVTLSFAPAQNIKDTAENALTNTTPTGTNNATYTIDNTPPKVSLSASPSSITEAAGTSTITATLNKVAATDTIVTLTKAGNATTTTDYTLSSSTITTTAGQTTGTASVTAVQDTTYEGNETIILDITTVTGGDSATENGTQQATVTITDDDSAPAPAPDPDPTPPPTPVVPVVPITPPTPVVPVVSTTPTISTAPTTPTPPATQTPDPITIPVQAPTPEPTLLPLAPIITPTTIDGAEVTTSTTTQIRTTTTGTTQTPRTQTVEQYTITPTTINREETIGSPATADVPLFWGDGARTIWATTADLPTATGLIATGSRSPNTNTIPNTAIQDLLYYIDAVTPAIDTNKQDMLKGGESFLDSLKSALETLIVNKVVLTSTSAQASDIAIGITGAQTTIQTTNGKLSPIEALVIDASTLPKNSTLDLENIEFAVIRGDNLIIKGGAGANTLFAGDGSQNITLGEGDDKLYAGADNDTVSGGSGNDTIHGGVGSDKATFDKNKSDYNITYLNASVVITNKATGDKDKVINAETLSFKDGDIAINYTPELNILAGLYKQVFNRQADLNGIEYWATQKLSNGMSYGEMGLHFLNSKEFINKYGSTIENMTSPEAINSLYQAFLGREADKVGFEFWSGAYTNGASLRDITTQFVSSVEFVGIKGIETTGWDFGV